MEQFRTMWKNPRNKSEDAKEEEILLYSNSLTNKIRAAGVANS